MAKHQRQKVAFEYTAPQAKSVLLVGDFTGWQEAPLAMKKSKTGVWKRVVSLAPGCYEYRLLVDGEWRDDPACPGRRSNPFGGENCVCEVQAPSATGLDG